MNEFIKNISEPNANSLLGKLWEAASFELALKFAVLYLCIILIAIIVWVVKDITNRTANIYIQIMCILMVVLLPFVGIFLYLLVRPSNTLLEKYYAEIEENLNTMAEFIAAHTDNKSSELSGDVHKPEKHKKKKNKKD